MITHTNNGSKWLLVPVKYGAKHISIKGCTIFYGYKDNNLPIVEGLREHQIILPPGNYSIVGLASELTGTQKQEILKDDSLPKMAHHKVLFYNYQEQKYNLVTATEGLESFLLSYSLMPETTLIIKKQ